MAEILPDPPISPDVDLRKFSWIKIDIDALFNSDFDKTHDDSGWRFGVTLWCRSWHQVPAGSLPDDDRAICQMAGLGRDLATWERHKSVALHGFVKCSDGRLYHPKICEMALEAAATLKRREADRERKRAKARGENSAPPTKEAAVPSKHGPAAEVRKLFFDLRMKLWPNAAPPQSAWMTADAVISRYMSDGATADQLKSIIRSKLERMAASDPSDVPNSLKIIQYDVKNLLRGKSNDKGFGNAKASRTAYDPEASRGRTLEAFSGPVVRGNEE